jgi:hypothetical protein
MWRLDERATAPRARQNSPSKGTAMTNRTDYPPVKQHASEVRPPASWHSAAHWPIRSASLTAGIALLLMSVVAIFGNVVVIDGLITEGDATRTAANIMGSQGLFRLGIASLVIVVALDVVVAWALFRVFSPVNRSLSMLAAMLRLVYSGVFMVSIGQLLGAIRLLSANSNLGILGADQLNAQAMVEITAFNDIWHVGQFLFGLHLLVIGYLAYRSGYVPRVLGVLLAISGLGYATDSVGAVLSQGSWTDISAFTFIGEFLLALWLVIRARRIAASASALEAEPGTGRAIEINT